ncbi:MAG: hypothetical protein AAGF83_16010 [Cyanobacteria bacterium P01_G01_bin.67]
MNQENISYIRKKLENRFLKFRQIDSQMFADILKQFWKFIQQTPILKSILDNLNTDTRQNEYEILVNEFYNKAPHYDLTGIGKEFDLHKLSDYDEKRYALLCCLIINRCCSLESTDQYSIQSIGKYVNFWSNDIDRGIEKFFTEIINPLYQYINEQLDEQKLTVELIRRYKQKSEWFKRQYLYEIWKDNTSKGEKILALDLYEYLFDCGLEFSIEPWSIDGEPDLVLAQKDDPLIADTKIFKHNKSYIIKGFNQVYAYTLTYNQPFGYFIIYNTCEKDLRFSLQNQTHSTQFITVNNKTIFITVINIYQHEKTASQRKIVKPTEITEQELTASL